jgi:hypothetical protein
MGMQAQNKITRGNEASHDLNYIHPVDCLVPELNRTRKGIIFANFHTAENY